MKGADRLRLFDALSVNCRGYDLAALAVVAAKAGRLRVAPADAAAQLVAANVGVTLSLIAQPEDATDLALSDRVREAALRGVFVVNQGAHGTSPNDARASAAVALTATLDDGDLLTAGERALLRELLDRLTNQAVAGTLLNLGAIDHQGPAEETPAAMPPRSAV